jgi:formate dehydrogenase subunit gamma
MPNKTHKISPNKFRDWHADSASSLLKKLDADDDNLLDALHFFQNEFGYIDKELIPLLAKFYNLSRADVHGVVSFYEDFREQKPAAYVLKICQAESCQAMGSRKLTADIKEHLGIGFHETNHEKGISLEPVYCLGNCSCSPNVMINSSILSRVDSEELKQTLNRLSDKNNA